MPLPLAAEEEYFTWVDAEGRIHNTLKSSQTPRQEQVSTSPNISAENEFLDEEQLASKLAEEQKNKPPFYIWIDSSGQRHTEFVTPETASAVSETSAVEEEFFDHSLIPPMRLPQHIYDGPCCGQYLKAFADSIPENKSVLFSRPGSNTLFRTVKGEAPAWFFNVRRGPTNHILSVILRGDHSGPALLALDKHAKPLHLIPALSGVINAETWASVENRESRIEVADPDVTHFILYFPNGAAADASAEIEWLPVSH